VDVQAREAGWTVNASAGNERGGGHPGRFLMPKEGSMILDFNKNPDLNRQYSIHDAKTGEWLGYRVARIFYADDEAGYYHQYIVDARKLLYVWDERTKTRITGRVSDSGVPKQYIELAWERVDLPIMFRRRSESNPYWPPDKDESWRDRALRDPML
jgi:hypothetical protein